MSYTVRHTPKVNKFLEKRIKYYEEARTGFGKKFLDEYEFSLKRIA